MQLVRRTLAIATALASAFALSGCIPQPPGPGSDAPLWAPTGEAAPADVQKYYGQDVPWTACADKWCGTVTAPMDWFGTSEKTIELSVVVAPATGERKGAIFYNPGGPGASGADYVRSYAEVLVAEEVRENFDVVGFDPRGVGASTPISCYEDPKELYDWLWEVSDEEVEPLSDADFELQVESAEWFAESCLKNTGEFLEFVGTEQVASDLDLLRSLMGDEQLNYFGVSYGTLIGSIYADLFPENVGRMVLDAAVAPDATDAEGTLYQAQGFELAYGNFVADCLQQEECPFAGASREEALTETRELLDSLDEAPLRVEDGRELSSGSLFIAIAANLYAEQQWPTLVEVLTDVKAGSGESAFREADAYYGVEPDGTFSDNSLEALISVNCSDAPAVTDWDEVRRNAADIERVAPTLGANFTGLSSCVAWPFEPTRTPKKITAPGANPIIVIGGINDPATAYEESVRLADMLESGVLISVDSEGHGQYQSVGECVDGPVNEYFMSGVAPTSDLIC